MAGGAGDEPGGKEGGVEMALAKVKLNSSGGKGQARFTRRADAKAGSRKRCRAADKKAVR